VLAPDSFEELKILRVSRTDLQHRAGRVPAEPHGFVNLINMRLARDFHRNHFDAIFTRQLKYPLQTFLAHALE